MSRKKKSISPVVGLPLQSFSVPLPEITIAKNVDIDDLEYYDQFLPLYNDTERANREGDPIRKTNTDNLRLRTAVIGLTPAERIAQLKSLPIYNVKGEEELYIGQNELYFLEKLKELEELEPTAIAKRIHRHPQMRTTIPGQTVFRRPETRGNVAKMQALVRGYLSRRRPRAAQVKKKYKSRGKKGKKGKKGKNGKKSIKVKGKR